MTLLQKALRLSNLSTGFTLSSLHFNRLSTSPVWYYSPRISLEEKLGIPLKPKRPLTPFLRFVSRNREDVLQHHPKASVTEVTKICAERWKKADNALKEELQAEFQKEKEKFIAELEIYHKMLSQDNIEELARAKEDAKSAKERKALKKKKEELGCPKRPDTSYLRFLKSRLPKKLNGPLPDFVKSIKTEWATLPPDEKKKFHDEYLADRDVYYEKLDRWLAQMKEEGHDFAQNVPRIVKPKDVPKKPGAAFNYYQKVKLGGLPPKELTQELQKKIHDDWLNLSKEEKKKYEEMRKKEKEEYKVKMEEWSKAKEAKANLGERGECHLYKDSAPSSTEPSLTDLNQQKNMNNNLLSDSTLSTKPQPNQSTVVTDLSPSSESNNKKSNYSQSSYYNPHKLFTSDLIYYSVVVSASVVVLFALYLFIFY